ncbi:histidine phosphatase family protein [Leifsonia aquatica]|uniref:histidine phosphatase family protein n=1 Tax=Leifsonia aquatica TaxID=144185 RepID=UPI0028A5A6C4|nr:histidine phosphatase family protein [Leifsonia aquatica]
MTAAKILLIRHGESIANVAATAAEAAGAQTIDVTARDADVPLSALGEQQAASLRPRLQDELGAEWDRALVWSSPYRRAVNTAQLALGDRAFAIDERLRDRELGILDALTSRGVEARLPDEAARRRWLGKFYYRPPGGESWTDVALRLRSFALELGGADGRTVLLFTHDAVVSLFLYVLLGWTEEQLNAFLVDRVVGNATVTTLVADGPVWRVEAFSDDAHLTAAGLPATEHPGAARVID